MFARDFQFLNVCVLQDVGFQSEVFLLTTSDEVFILTTSDEVFLLTISDEAQFVFFRLAC
jgi:hypothetical protein